MRQQPPNPAKARRAFKDFIRHLGIGLAPGDLDLLTRRVVASWPRDLLDGYRLDPERLLKDVFPSKKPVTVVLRDLHFHAFCPHHLLPYSGSVDLAYAAQDQLAGFGTVALALRAFSHRLTLQEDLGHNLLTWLARKLKVRGAVARIETRQPCLALIDERQHRSRVVTWHATGCLTERQGHKLFAPSRPPRMK